MSNVQNELDISWSTSALDCILGHPVLAHCGYTHILTACPKAAVGVLYKVYKSSTRTKRTTGVMDRPLCAVGTPGGMKIPQP
jgi:hypothetical protein